MMPPADDYATEQREPTKAPPRSWLAIERLLIEAGFGELVDAEAGEPTNLPPDDSAKPRPPSG
jgi:hypothetical protein